MSHGYVSNGTLENKVNQAGPRWVETQQKMRAWSVQLRVCEKKKTIGRNLGKLL